MTKISTAGRIDEPFFKAITGTLFGFSILTAIIRTVYRVRSHKRLLLDDYVLIFACVTLTAANGILFSLIPTIYWYEDSILDPNLQAIQTTDLLAVFWAQTLRYQQMAFMFLTLSWTTVFAVKLCFLLFFHQMLDRLKSLMLMWKIVLGITMFLYPLAVCGCGIFIACPQLDIISSKCGQGTGFTINLAVSATVIALDITTDSLIIMIPIVMLWKVKIRRSQKIVLGIFLCLSICMIVTAIVRISKLRILHRNIDMQWKVFWLETEANIAVIMVSITAFRSIFGLQALKHREKKERAGYWYRRKLLFGKANNSSECELNGHQLPSIPGARLTGIRTFIRGGRDSKMIASRVDVMGSMEDRMETEQQWIKSTQKISSESEHTLKDGSAASIANIV